MAGSGLLITRDIKKLWHTTCNNNWYQNKISKNKGGFLMKRKAFLAVLLVLSIVSLTACSGGGGNSNSSELYIASANPMTGDSAQFGDMKVKAIELALDEVNKEGGIEGKQ